MELYTIEQLEGDLDSTSDLGKKKYIQQQIQGRNLQLSRLMPNE